MALYCSPQHKPTDLIGFVIDIFLESVAACKNEGVLLRLMWSLDRGIEHGIFTPQHIAEALLSRRELVPENQLFFRAVFTFLLKLVFYLDYKSNRMVFTKSIDKTYNHIPSSSGIPFRNPAIELVQILLCREINLLPALFTMYELRGEKSSRPSKLIEAEVEHFMSEFDYPLRILYSYNELNMVPIAGITQGKHPSFRLESELTLSILRQPILYPPAFKSRQLGLTCDLLGQLRCTQLASSLLACEERQTMGPNQTPMGQAVSDLIFVFMGVIETEKNTKWAVRIFSHLANLVISFILDRVVRLNDIISNLNSKASFTIWPISRHFVMWFTLVCMSGFVGSNKLTDFVSCLHLFDQLFPEANELDNDAVKRLEKIKADRPEFWGSEKHQLITTKTLEALGTGDPDLRFLLFISEHLITKSSDLSADDGQMAENGAEDHSSSCSSNDLEITRKSERGVSVDIPLKDLPTNVLVMFDTAPTKKAKLEGEELVNTEDKEEDLTHMVAACACIWEIILQMNSEESMGRGVKDCHLPRPLPPLLHPLRTQIATWLENLREACSGISTVTEIGDTSADVETQQVVHALSWLEFIITLNAYSPTENFSITRSVVASLWLPNNIPLPGIGGGLPLDNGPFTLPYGLTGAGRRIPLSNRLIQKMSIHLQLKFCNEMLQKLSEKTKPLSMETKNAHLTSPATLETFGRFLSYQMAKKIIPLREIYRRLLVESRSLHIPLYYDKSESDNNNDFYPPVRDDFYSLTFWFDLLGHRWIEALPVEHRLRYRDELFLRVNLNSHELIYALDWIIVRFSRRILTPDCVLYNIQSVPFQQQHFLHLQPPHHHQQIYSHSREVTSRVVLFSTLQAVCAYDLIDEEPLVRTKTDQLMAVRTETRAIFGEECSQFKLPAVIARLVDLLPPSAAQVLLPPLQSSSPPSQPPPIFPAEATMESSSNESSESLYFSLRERLLTSAFDIYKSLSSDSENDFKWAELNIQNERCLCTILIAIMKDKGAIPIFLLNNLLQMSPALMHTQVKVLCEFLVTQVCKFEEFDRRKLPPPDYIFSPSALCSATITFSVQYGIITLDRLLLYLFMRSNHSLIDVAAGHSIALFLITQCPQLIQAIQAVGEFAPESKNILSSRRWPDLLLLLHEILPEKQMIILPPSTRGRGGGQPAASSPLNSTPSAVILRRRPCQPVYYDHLVLRLIPILEIILTSFLDNPPPLLQLAQFCDIIAPLFRLHSYLFTAHPMSLCFLLLRSQFHHFSSSSSGSGGGAAIGTTTPTTPAGSSQQLVAWRNPTQVDKVACQLVLRSILHLHHQLAVRVNAKRECALVFGGEVSGLLSPPAWKTLDTLHNAALARGEPTDQASRDSDFIDCLRMVYGTDAEIRLASALTLSAEEAFPSDLELHILRLLQPVVAVTTNHGLSGVPSAWRDWRSEEAVNPQAAGIYAVAVELMALHPPSDTSRVSNAASCLLECLRKVPGSNDFQKWLNVTGALVSILPFVFRHNILCLTCTLINDPCFNDAELWPQTLLTLKIGTVPSLQPPKQLIKVFRFRRALSAQPTRLTIFREEKEAQETALRVSREDEASRWEVLGRPHASSVRFFDTILPAQLPQGENLPNHLFKAAVWHAIWSHVNFYENPTLLRRIFDEFLLKHINNEAKLLMAFSMVTPPLKALTNDKSAIVDLTVSLYKALQQVDEALAAKNIPLYHVNTIADLLYHIKYSYVGKAGQDEVQGLLLKMRPHLQACLKFIFSSSPVNPDGISLLNGYPKFEDREYRAALKPPALIEDEFF
ncbi:unnamed protein product [Hymenolepis diminuta]|uniref:Mediator of RNA polymerase II transcription subunit 23 n=1 Tax=Hymenolepis diminuta TaxID=6216 RepID=A0A158QF07_HYMDI|nr:unnamed protein product [Hymenolepis diminuta]